MASVCWSFSLLQELYLNLISWSIIILREYMKQFTPVLCLWFRPIHHKIFGFCSFFLITFFNNLKKLKKWEVYIFDFVLLKFSYIIKTLLFYPINVQCHIFIPPENIRKTRGATEYEYDAEIKKIMWIINIFTLFLLLCWKQSSRGVLMKMCSERYAVAVLKLKKRYWNHTLALVFSWEFVACFWIPHCSNTSGGAASVVLN